MQINAFRYFSYNLLQWNSIFYRNMPWRGEKNPYKVWLSEIILQQTRVEQGLPYYLKFVERYPNIESLANAPQQEILKNWEGLGYYSRAKNMHFAAKQILKEFNGEFPKSYADILKLKGVGKYTAAAISSFAFGEKYAIIDGNVKRIMSRYFGIEHAIDTALGEKAIEYSVNACLDDFNVANFNQALLDFGAMLCKPKTPLCVQCPMNEKCVAYKSNIVHKLPIKEKKILKQKRFFNYFLIIENDKIWIKQRTENDIWEGLFDFPLIETSSQVLENEIKKMVENIFNGKFKIIEKIELKQVLTHQIIYANFFVLNVKGKLKLEKSEQVQINISDLHEYPKPKIINTLIQKINILNIKN
jgi:A/G-specific adenine glycosylase